MELKVEENVEVEENAQTEAVGLPPLDPTIVKQILTF